ncbi:hypothetical protein GCM10022403_012410 [Streptomyces coacervatus]|uniref:Uncharacterized protein n=1 Tax=Streptomyces coacervatus TaxID=647381 RepID=A0ABP7H0R4_9ACTN|nr:hypothetical protein [Streptomyces coacervatus]MDF2273255.1 hypothetical protein [Streptomyces coacervatus]
MTALVGALVFVTATDASAKRKRPKYNQSFAKFVDDYRPPKDTFRCSYLEKVGGIKVEDWVCNAGENSTPKLFAEMLAPDTDSGRGAGLWWQNKGWKYLAAPQNFRCTIVNAQLEKTADNYNCSFVDQGKKGGGRLSNTMLATSDDGTRWYLQRRPYPPNPSPTPAP